MKILQLTTYKGIMYYISKPILLNQIGTHLFPPKFFKEKDIPSFKGDS